MRLPSGRWLVGRAPQAHVRCDDPFLEPFHLELSLWPQGEFRIHQLAGKRPVRCEGDRVELGSSVLVVAHIDAFPVRCVQPAPGASPTTRQCPQRRVVIRSSRVRIDWAPTPLPPVPALVASERSGPSGAAMTSTGVGIAAGLVIGVALGQPLLALFALVGGLAASSAWLVDLASARRRERAARSEHAAAMDARTRLALRQRDEFAHHHRAVTLTIVAALGTVESSESSSAGVFDGGADRRPLGGVWERRTVDGDAFAPSVGPGTVQWVADGVPVGLDDLPVPIDLGEGARVALIGPHATSLVRSLLVQLATATGPADWRLMVVSDDAAAWSWCAPLPHLLKAGTGVHVFNDAALDAAVDAALDEMLTECSNARESTPPCHTIVVTDRIESVTARTSAVRRAFDRASSWALVVIDESPFVVAPAVCSTVVTTLVDGRARYTTPSTQTGPTELRIAGLGAAAAAVAADRLGNLIDPEWMAPVAASLPSSVTLESLITLEDPGEDSDEAASGLKTTECDGPVAATLGVGAAGPVTVDLARDGPHVLVAGTTGSGKSELLRSLVISVARACPPEQVSFVLVDFKGGAAFDAVRSLPHVTALVTDLEPTMVSRLVRSLEAELVSRERLLREHGATDLTDLRLRAGDPVVPRVVVVIDEFAVLATDHPSTLQALLGVARRGRSLGMHLVLATQRPTGIVSDEIRANTDLRIALRLIDPIDAMDVIGDPAPAAFPRSAAGRLAMRIGSDSVVVVQGARCIDPRAACDAIGAATRRLRREGPRWCLWTPPLPKVLTVEDVPVGSVGWIDDPDRQRREPLAWGFDQSHLLVVGAVGSGVTSTLITTAVTAGDQYDLLVIDALDDDRWQTVGLHSWCAGVVRPHQRERVWRMLARAASARPESPCLLVVDGLHALRSSLDSVERMDDAARLDSLLADPPPGLSLMIGADRMAGIPPSLVGRCPQRWILRLHDRVDMAMAGVPPDLVADGPVVPGRLVIIGGGSANIAQVVNAPRFPPPDRRRTAHVVDLPSVVRAEPGGCRDAGTVRDPSGWWRPVIGVRADDLGSAAMEIPPGDHLLVVGPPRSGRSAALGLILELWCASRPDGQAAVVAPRRSPLHGASTSLEAALASAREATRAGRPALLVVDDAETVHDLTGELHDLLAGSPGELLVVAAVRPDSIRQAYGHWTSAVKRSRLGLVMSLSDDLDGDLLGVSLPRRHPIAARPGLAWLAGGGAAVLAQVWLPSRPVRADAVPAQVLSAMGG